MIDFSLIANTCTLSHLWIVHSLQYGCHLANPQKLFWECRETLNFRRNVSFLLGWQSWINLESSGLMGLSTCGGYSSWNVMLIVESCFGILGMIRHCLLDGIRHYASRMYCLSLSMFGLPLWFWQRVFLWLLISKSIRFPFQYLI